MPVVVFDVSFDKDVTEKVPVAVDMARTLRHALTALNRKLGAVLPLASAKACADPDKVDVRKSNGEPLRDWSRTLTDLGIADMAHVIVITSCVATSAVKSAIEADRAAREASAVSLDPEPAVGEADGDNEESGGEADGPTDLQPSGRRPQQVRVKDAPEASEALHLLDMDGSVQRVYSKRRVAFGDVVCFEKPTLAVGYPMQLAETVNRDPNLRSRTYDPSASRMESALRGVDSEDYSKYLSIAVTHGRPVKSNNSRFDRQLAFFSKIGCVRHSCCPSAAFTYNVTKAPHFGVLRCARSAGIEEGDEITMLLDAVNRPEFMVLPVDRRQKLLQADYHFTCKCDRCMKSGAGPTRADVESAGATVTAALMTEMTMAEREATLTGAFWGPNVGQPGKTRQQLAARMRDSFNALGVVSGSDDCALLNLPSSLARIPLSDLFDFITLHSSDDSDLRLHRNHWRLSLVRMVYLRNLVAACSKTKSTKELERRTFDIAIDQLFTECFFMPSGHPHTLPTYRAFKALVGMLPPKLAAEVQKKALDLVPTDWEALAQLDVTTRKRASAAKKASAAKPAAAAAKNDETSSDDEFSEGAKEAAAQVAARAAKAKPSAA